MAGDRETGICLMKMEEGLDTGPIFSSAKVPIGSTETTGSLHDRLCQEACTLIASDLGPILAGELVPEPQSSVGITYAHKLGRDEGEIDWSGSAREIQRKVLGLSPSPGAFTYLNSERFRILDALAHDNETPLGVVPGEVIVTDGSPPCLIATGSGTLALRIVQREGRQPVAIEDLLRGRSLQSKMILGARSGMATETSP
jgi:methionyl-tRNA formyltransferase